MRPLAGTRVLDLTRLLPGGFCTIVLADLGAEVVKVEEPGAGDPIRAYTAPTGRAVFSTHCTVASGVTWTPRNPDGRDLLLRLVTTADVLVEGFRPAPSTTSGSATSTSGRQPTTRHLRDHRVRRWGPESAAPGMTWNYLAEAGALPFGAASAGGRPALPALQSADLGAGALAGVTAILAALLERHHTGKGQILDIGMAPGILSWLGLPAAEWLECGSVPTGGEAALNGGLACYGVYPTADGRWLSVAALEAKFWVTLCTMLGRLTFIARHWTRPTSRNAG
jgi:crotonobetainyl-CoA:carnitine CoA-transferase CaiB-like acyl-CoA transferase